MLELRAALVVTENGTFSEGNLERQQNVTAVSFGYTARGSLPHFQPPEP